MKILKNKWFLIGAAIVVAYFIFCPKAEAGTLEVGQYENRIDGGLYTGEGNYAILSGEVGVFGGSVEYVDTEDASIYTTLETGLSTPLGDIGVYGLLSSVDDDNVFEVGATYGLSIFNVNTIVDVAIDEDSQYTVDLGTEVLVLDNGAFEVSLGGSIGKTFEYDVNYDYILAYAKVSIDALFVKVNYLQNDLYSESFEATTDFGISFDF
jgi:hypothetical protein